MNTKLAAIIAAMLIIVASISGCGETTHVVTQEEYQQANEEIDSTANNDGLGTFTDTTTTDTTAEPDYSMYESASIDTAYDFTSKGRAWVKYSVSNTKMLGYINTDGRVLFSITDYSDFLIADDIASVSDNDGHYYILNNSGEIVSDSLTGGYDEG